MKRFTNWDYRKPYYYMVTLKRRPNLPALSRLEANDPWGYDPRHPITRAFAETIQSVIANSPGIEAIAPYVIMPDHLHLLIKIADIPTREALGTYVRILKHRLRQTFQALTGSTSPLFEKDYHDLIVKAPKQLPNFTHYIRNNPKMALLRQKHAEHFHCYRGYTHWRLPDLPVDIVGNPELLDEPGMVAIRISRKVQENTPEWAAQVERWRLTRPGITAIGTWWSIGEKAALQKILTNGGNAIVLSPEGIPERWHPPGNEMQTYCAQGRLLYLSPYPPQTYALKQGIPRTRCLALNDLAKQMAEAIYAG